MEVAAGNDGGCVDMRDVEGTCVDSDLELDENDLFADKYVLRKCGRVDMDGEESCDDEDDLFADAYVLRQGGSLENGDNQNTVVETNVSAVGENNPATPQGEKVCGNCRRPRPLEDFRRAVGATGSTNRYSSKWCFMCRGYEYRRRIGLKTPGVCRYCCKPMHHAAADRRVRVTCNGCAPLLLSAEKIRKRECAAAGPSFCATPQCNARVRVRGHCCKDHSNTTPESRRGRSAIGICASCLNPIVSGSIHCELHLQQRRYKYARLRVIACGM